jgi:ubiquinone/menaquinone biosynthesis C-methylase UbiE
MIHHRSILKICGAQFGKSTQNYTEGRKGYPASLFDQIESFLPKESRILELGCGTGIATQELWSRGYHNILSTDVDKRMVQKAQASCPEIVFQLADAHQLHFENQTFDTVCAFGCFHWFCDAQAIIETKRVLKTGGRFIVVNKRDLGPFRKEFRAFLSRILQKTILEPKALYRPIQKLRTNEFKIIKHFFASKETFSSTELIKFCQSTSLWNSLSHQEQQTILPALRNFIEERMKNGVFERPVEIQCILAIKN